MELFLELRWGLHLGMGRLGEAAPKLLLWELPGLVGDRASRGSKSPGKIGTFLSHEHKAAGGQQFCLPRLEPGPSPTPSWPPPLLSVCAPTLFPPTVPGPSGVLLFLLAPPLLPSKPICFHGQASQARSPPSRLNPLLFSLSTSSLVSAGLPPS